MNPGHAVAVIERNALAYRRLWKIFVTGFFDPVLFLLSIGVGVGGLVGALQVEGRSVPYDSFVAPALMATAAMNGTVFDVTFNFFFKFKYSKTFDAMLSTPLGVMDVAVGEMGWALLRGTIYATAFLIVMTAMGLVESAWAVLCIPGSMLIGFGFAGIGMAATTYMRSFVDFDKINLALIPLFLFSATFFPLYRYPGAVQWLVQATPLYQGVALLRSLTLGNIDLAMLGHIAYLAAMGAVGVRITARRLAKLLQP